MTESTQRLHHWIRRPHLLSSALLGAVCFGLLLPHMASTHALLLAFDLAAASFLALMLAVVLRATPQSMHRRALVQEQGKWTVLVMSLCVAGVVLGALSSELHAAKNKSIGDIVLASATLLLAWLFVAFMFSQQYAHSFYVQPGQLVFPSCEQPDYWDFLYFATVLSMCCQTSDVAVTSRAMRKLVMLHSLVSFFFNVIIIAITVNVVAGVL